MPDGDLCKHTVTGTDGQTYTCGQVHDPRKCRGHKTIRDDDGKAFSGTPRPIIGVRPCKQSPLKGMDVCRSHGGRGGRGGAERTKATVEKRIAEAKAVEAVVTFGLSREIDPRDALLEEVYRTAGAVDWLHKQVQALQPTDVIWGKTKAEDHQATEFPGTNTTQAAAVNVWVELWQKERLHLVRVAKEAIAAGIEERKVRLAEQQGAMLAGVIKAILGDLDLSPEQQAKVATVVPRRLRAVADAA